MSSLRLTQTRTNCFRTAASLATHRIEVLKSDKAKSEDELTLRYDLLCKSLRETTGSVFIF